MNVRRFEMNTMQVSLTRKRTRLFKPLQAGPRVLMILIKQLIINNGNINVLNGILCTSGYLARQTDIPFKISFKNQNECLLRQCEGSATSFIRKRIVVSKLIGEMPYYSKFTGKGGNVYFGYDILALNTLFTMSDQKRKKTILLNDYHIIENYTK